MSDIDEARVERLCAALREIVLVELAFGNRICETWDAEGDWGLGIMLERPFLQAHSSVLLSGDIEFIDVNDPHYWKAQYHSVRLKQCVACRF